MRIVQLMNSAAARTGRALAGLVIIAAGAATGGMVLAVAGLVPLAAGTFGRCLAAPLFRALVRSR
jgi:hypothetical protein